MNTESVACRKVVRSATPEEVGMEKAGDFCFSGDMKTFFVWLPGMIGPIAIEIQKGAPGGPRVWGWDGNEDKPTITPSIHSIGRWHGWLKAGKLESC